MAKKNLAAAGTKAANNKKTASPTKTKKEAAKAPAKQETQAGEELDPGTTGGQANSLDPQTSIGTEDPSAAPAAGPTGDPDPQGLTGSQDPQAPQYFTRDELISELLEEGFQIVSVGGTALHSDSEDPVIVIPYKKDSAAGDELKFAVRAWERYLPGCKIVVIGDAEPWFSPELIHIDVEPVDSNPQIDVARKMIIAIASDEIPEKFIWSNDDIVPVSHVHLADIELPKVNGKLIVTDDQAKRIYGINKKRTIDILNEHGFPTWDYSTHTPFLFSKSRLAFIIDLYNADEEGHLVSSLYFNRETPENLRPVKITGGKDCVFAAYVYREDPPMDIVKKAFAERKYVNYNDRGYKAVKGILQEMFPEKSRFEV